MNFVLVFINHSSYETQIISVLSITVVFAVWYKIFYWMRLFEEPAFFMNLLYKTLFGIVPFTFMSLILLLMYSNMIYIMNSQSQGAPILDTIVEVPFLNEIINMYLLVIGEYSFENFNDSGPMTSFVCWLIFFSATFML